MPFILGTESIICHRRAGSREWDRALEVAVREGQRGRHGHGKGERSASSGGNQTKERLVRRSSGGGEAAGGAAHPLRRPEVCFVADGLEIPAEARRRGLGHLLGGNEARAVEAGHDGVGSSRSEERERREHGAAARHLVRAHGHGRCLSDAALRPHSGAGRDEGRA